MIRCVLLVLALFALVGTSRAEAAIKLGWAPTANTLTNRNSHAATLLNDGRVLVAGGSLPGGDTARTEIYDPTTQVWTPAASMGAVRSSFGLITLRDGRALAVGGEAAQPTAELYNPATNTWSPTGRMSTYRNTVSLALLDSGKVLAVSKNGYSSSAWSAEVFDPATNQWTSAGIPATSDTQPTAAVIAGGRVVTPGANADSNLYLGGTNWTGLASARRYNAVLSPLPDGGALLTGGVDPSNQALLRLTERLSPINFQWNTVAPALHARSWHLAPYVGNGHVMVLGGVVDGGYSTVTELYNSATNTWTESGSMSLYRSYFTATLLKDGRLLIVGGDWNAQREELWTPQTSLMAEPEAEFGDQAIGTSAGALVQITNTGPWPIASEGYTLTGPGADDFAIDASACRIGVAPSSSCRLDVRFAPKGTGTRSATLTFTANTVPATHSIRLTGRGLQPPPGTGTGTPLPGGGGAGLDTDGDGVLDAADRCAKLPGPSARQGCPSGLLGDPSIAYRKGRQGIRVVAYYVKATTGARVEVRCSRGCKTTVVSGRGARRIRITHLNGKRLTNGTKITITVSMAGRLTTTVTDTITRGRRIEGRPVCAPVAC